MDKHSQKLLDPGQVFLLKRGAREEKGLAQRQDRGRCLLKRGVRFGTKAGLKPVHDGTIFYSICL